MVTDRQLEIYKQRYETFRFFYRLEWQLLQVGVVIGLGLFALGVENENGNPNNWRYFASGSVFLGFSYAMHRMAKSTMENYPSWIEYARVVGDFNVRAPGEWWGSAAVWGRVLLHSLGVMLILCAICRVDAIPSWSQNLIIAILIIWQAAWIAWQTLLKETCCPREILVTVCVILFLEGILFVIAVTESPWL